MIPFLSSRPFSNAPAGARFSRQGRLAGLAVLLLFATAARANDFVVVSAEAIPQYRRTSAPQGGLAVETYVFSPGRYFSGQARDASEEATQFRAIAESLAPALAKQNYLPSRDPKHADLLLIVHWGTTQTYDDPNRELTIEQLNSALAEYRSAAGATGDADPGAINQIGMDIASHGSLQERFMKDNAELLGYQRSLQKRERRLYASEEEQTMRYELAEPRYFVILMAYDYRVLQKEKRRLLLWTTHMNVRSAGTNFRIALPAMTSAAATFFGQDRSDPVHLDRPLRSGRVEVGTPQVVPDKK